MSWTRPDGHSLDKCLIHLRDHTWGAQMFDVTRQNVVTTRVGKWAASSSGGRRKMSLSFFPFLAQRGY